MYDLTWELNSNKDKSERNVVFSEKKLNFCILISIEKNNYNMMQNPVQSKGVFERWDQ